VIEKLNVAKILMNDMSIDLHGVEVILWMRDSTFRMRRKFDEKMEDPSGDILRIMPQQKK
jgi:hypothetical protein